MNPIELLNTNIPTEKKNMFEQRVDTIGFFWNITGGEIYFQPFLPIIVSLFCLGKWSCCPFPSLSSLKK